MSPPVSPPRRAELFGVHLRVLPVRAPVPVTRGRLTALSRARATRRRMLTPASGAAGPVQGALVVAAGQAVEIDVAAARLGRLRLAFSGQQPVRAIFLDRARKFIADVYVAGSQVLNASTRTRHAVLVGEGAETAVASSVAGTAAGVSVARESVGVEHDTVLLAVGRQVFAGHGCVVETAAPLPFAAEPLDSVPGFELLRAAKRLTVHFPAVPQGWSLLLAVVPTVAVPRPAVGDVRWRSLDATLGGLTTVLGPDATAFVMSVAAAQPWSLEVDLGTDWQLASAVVCDHNGPSLVAFLRSRDEWDLVDDAFQQAPPGTSTNVTLEVA